MRAPSQRRALGALFLFLFLFFGGIAGAAAEAGQWPIALASGAIGLWLATLAGRALIARGLRPKE